MLDVAHEETSLETRRRELVSRIAEGHQVVDALKARQAAMARKIDEALDGVQRLQEQLKAVDVVIGMAGGGEVRFQPPPPIAPVLEVVPASVDPKTPAMSVKSQPFRPIAYLKCIADGHDYMNSRAMPGYMTCRRCRMRRIG